MDEIIVNDLVVVTKEYIRRVSETLDGDVMFLHARCHPNQPLHARIRGVDMLILSCAVCSKDVIAVPLADKEE